MPRKHSSNDVAVLVLSQDLFKHEFQHSSESTRSIYFEANSVNEFFLRVSLRSAFPCNEKHETISPSDHFPIFNWIKLGLDPVAAIILYHFII
jgi:hypothetical protein